MAGYGLNSGGWLLVAATAPGHQNILMEALGAVMHLFESSFIHWLCGERGSEQAHNARWGWGNGVTFVMVCDWCVVS